MLRHIIVFFLLVPAGLLMSCAETGTADHPEYVSLRGMLERNQDHIEQLKIGMNEDAVLKLMGFMRAESHDGLVRNPFRREGYVADNGVRYEILYYYTHPYAKFHNILDADLTPILIKNGQVVGWGWSTVHQVKGW